MVTSGGLQILRDWLAGSQPNAPSYIVLGSGHVTLGSFMTVVPGETFRAPIVAADPAGNSVTFTAFLGPTDNAGQSVYCYGLVGGAASAAVNTGTLIALQPEPSPFGKNASNTLTIPFVLMLSGVIS